MNDETFTDESEWVLTSNHDIPGPSSIVRSPSVAGSVDSGYSIRSGSAYLPRPPIVHRRPPPPQPITVTRRTPPDRPPPPPPRPRKSKRSAPHPPGRRSRGARTGRSHGCPTLVIRRRCLVIMSCVSLTLSAMSIAIFGLLLLTSYREPLEICVDCGGLNVSETDLLTSINEGQCCARTQAQLSTLIELVLKQTQKKLKCVSLTSHLAHLTLKKGWSSTLAFDGNLSRSVGDPVTLIENDSMLQIKNSGLYFIYSSIYFKFKDRCSMAENIEKRCDQYVIKGRDQTLLSSAHKCCSQGQFTSYSGGLFSLAAGDKLYVKVTNASLVDLDPTMTYMGLMMVRTSAATASNVGLTT